MSPPSSPVWTGSSPCREAGELEGDAVIAAPYVVEPDHADGSDNLMEDVFCGSEIDDDNDSITDICNYDQTAPADM